MPEKLEVLIIYGIIVTFLLLAPGFCVAKSFPWWLTLITLLPLALFVVMRSMRFMNEIESGLVCLILSALLGMLIPVVDIILEKRNASRDTKPTAACAPLDDKSSIDSFRNICQTPINPFVTPATLEDS